MNSPSSPADDAKRIADIQAAVQPLILEHAAWLALEHPGDCPDGLKLNMARVAFTLLSAGDFPQPLAKSWAALLVFAEKLALILSRDSELSDSRGNPKPSFWMAFQNVVDSLNVKTPARRVLPKLQKVMDEFNGDNRQFLWVAREFGRYDSNSGAWVGPFFQNGNENRAAILRELREPGSVLPAEFDPEAGRQVEVIELAAVPFGLLNSLQKHIAAAEPRLQEVHIDPATVEELLLQGQFPGTIARVKGLSEDEVRTEAARLGIRVTEMSDPYKPADIHSPDNAVYRANMLAPSTDAPASSPALRPVPDADSTVEDSSSSKGSESDQLNELLRSLIESNPEVDTPKAMQGVKAAGLTASGAVVGRKLSEIRRGMVPAN